MCYMVAVAFAPSAVESVRQVLNYELAPAPSYVAAAFESRTASFLLHVGHCACDHFSDPVGPDEINRLRLKYRKKGWSESRIERVLAERSRLGGLDLGLVQTIVAAARAAGGLSLLVYWDDGASTPSGPVVEAADHQLIAHPYMVRVGSRVDIAIERDP